MLSLPRLSLLTLLMGGLSSGQAIRPVVINYSHTVYSLRTPQTAWKTWNEIIAVKADGSSSVAREKSHSFGTEVRSWFTLHVNDVPSATYTVVDQLTLSKTTYPSTINADPTFRPASSCDGTKQASILGLSIVSQEKTTPIPRLREQAIDRSWRSPEANCLPLRVERTLRRIDGTGSLEVVAASLVEFRDPPDWMFTIPPNYIERKPSEVLSEAARLKGTADDYGSDQQDKAYDHGQTRLSKQP